jgi:Protein of unknown function (DUF2877)
VTALVVRVAGRGARGTTGGRVMAAGAGWAWLRTEAGPVHICGPRGPRSPLTAVVDRVPVLEPGARMRLDSSHAQEWITPPPPPPAAPDLIRDACAAVRPYLWNDPRARALATDPLESLVPDLVGRGPGLTPAGDDALVGYLLARRGIGAANVRHDAAVILAAGRRATGGPSLAFLRHAVRGEAAQPASVALAALLTAHGPNLAPAVRQLTAFGSSTGRAILTGLVGGLLAPHAQ